MDMNELKYSIEVKRCGSINKAASKLYITQPYLSACMKSLETELGFDIFIRSNKGICVTKEGEEFLNRAAIVIDQFETLENTYSRRKAVNPEFKVASVRSIMASNAFEKYYILNHHNGNLHEMGFYECGLLQVIDCVYNNEASLGIVMFYAKQVDYLEEYLKIKKMRMTTIGSLPACIIISKAHPLADCDYSELQEKLPQYPYTTYSDYIDSILNVANECSFGGLMVPEKIVYVQDRYSIMSLINMTNAFSISHRFSKKGENMFNIKSIPVPGGASLYFGYVETSRAYFRNSEREAHFIKILKETLKEYEEGK